MGRKVEPAIATPEEIQEGQRVIHLSTAIKNGTSDLAAIPTILKEIIRKGTWRRWYLLANHSWVEHRTFAEFVCDRKPKGLGESVERLRTLCRDDAEALDLLDKADQRQHGGDRRSEEFNVHNMNVEPRPHGDSPEAALRRLRKDRPDLHAQVIAGELSPHGAMVEAGFRPRKVQIPLDNLERAAKTLRKHLGEEGALALAALLATGMP